MNRTISIKRKHGLGNLIMLLSVLDRMMADGYSVELVTEPRWVDAFQELRPEIRFTDKARDSTIDLDARTESLRIHDSKPDKFAALLGVEGYVPQIPSIRVPDKWRRPYLHLENAVGFAPEAGHAGRRWSANYCTELCSRLVGTPLVLIGWERDLDLPNDHDFRGSSLEDLFGAISCLGSLITMDSGAMHVARSVGTPTVAIFGGIAPEIVTLEDDNLIAMQSGLDCFPCNKNETCGGSYDCIKGITPDAVLEALSQAKGNTSGRQIVTV